MHQRLTIQCNPVTPESISGAFEIYQWGVEQKHSVCLTATMVSGKGLIGYIGFGHTFEDEYINLR